MPSLELLILCFKKILIYRISKIEKLRKYSNYLNLSFLVNLKPKIDFRK